jgi:hypothetical protein
MCETRAPVFCFSHEAASPMGHRRHDSREGSPVAIMSLPARHSAGCSDSRLGGSIWPLTTHPGAAPRRELVREPAAM